jgi:hypothetical protein
MCRVEDGGRSRRPAFEGLTDQLHDLQDLAGRAPGYLVSLITGPALRGDCTPMTDQHAYETAEHEANVRAAERAHDQQNEARDKANEGRCATTHRWQSAYFWRSMEAPPSLFLRLLAISHRRPAFNSIIRTE